MTKINGGDELAIIAKGLEEARFGLMLVAAWSRDCDMQPQRKAVDAAIVALTSLRRDK